MLKKHPRYVIVCIAFIYFIGTLGITLEFSRELFQKLVPYTLLLSLLVLGLFHEKYTGRFIILSVIFYLAGFFVEVAGIATGVIFGGYAYGPTLGVKVWDTPLMIGVNWLLLIYCIWVVISRLRWNKLILAFLGAIVMVVYDLLLEPIAIWLDMWGWDGGKIPVQNYLAWLAISFVFFILMGSISPKIENKIAPALLVIQLAFFMILNMVTIWIT